MVRWYAGRPGWEPDGREFLSSRTRGRVQFYVGDVIRGWGEGLQLMNVNETARLWIPSDLAFGSEGKGGPPGDIVIDVTLYGLKRGQPAPPKPTELSVPKDAVIEKWPAVIYRTDVDIDIYKIIC